MIMSLKEEIFARRDSKIYCVESECRPMVMIKICPWEAKEWLLPWSRFEGSSFASDEEHEQMELFFSHHKVIILGHALEQLAKEISGYRVRCLRDLPESHRPAFEPEEPFIKRLEVLSLDGVKSPTQGNLPF
jgi:hypothetical protein